MDGVEVRQERLTVGDASLSVEIAGNGPDLVLVHSGITDRGMWDDQFPVFARHFRTVRYDLRGFGDSSDVAGPYSHAEDLQRVIQQLGVARPDIVAASLGARITIDLAIMEPGRLGSLVLVGPAISGARFEDPQLSACWEQIGEAWDAGDIERAIELETAIWIDGPSRPAGTSHRGAIERVREMQRDIFARAPEDDPEREIDPPAIDRLSELQMPVLVLVGEHDVSDIHRNARRIVDEAYDARLVVLPGTGHLPNLEAPDTFNEIVLTFLSAGGHA